MTLICEYCQSRCEEGALKCPNCSAPIQAQATPVADYRRCPFCRRKLLALASPACNFCGRRLPEEFIKAREGDLHRLNEVDAHSADAQVNAKLDTILRQTTRRDRHRSSLAELFEINIVDD